MNRVLNIKYSLSQIFYCAAICAMMGYASVYLLGEGFSNSLIGITLALSSIVAVILQPLIATIADKSSTAKINLVIRILLAVTIICSVAVYFIPMNKQILAFFVIVIFSLTTSLMPLINSFAFVFEKFGYKINFGVARGLGSAAYALTSIALGYVVSAINSSIIPLAYVLFNTLLYIIIQLYTVVDDNKDSKTNEEEQKSQLSFGQFVHKYIKFMVFLLGFVCIYFAHSIINNFFIQIVTNVGGNSSDMGNAVFVAAMLELPIMFMFNKLNEKVNCTLLIKISLVCFALKHILTLVATNMPMIYMAQVLQMGAYALFVPASVYYVNQIIEKNDMVKGQSFLTTSMTLAGVFASLAGGILLDMIGVHESLLLGAIVSVVGVVLGFLTLEKVK
ncbi:MFS transporter [Beduini massiliensis]|uniref:MFS transporter n=1 Tax=Beduini massiliensis TaxID=1585974 RepID=UPI00059AA8F3|nr:MFS transporter [Beduini massiliensis]